MNLRHFRIIALSKSNDVENPNRVFWCLGMQSMYILYSCREGPLSVSRGRFHSDMTTQSDASLKSRGDSNSRQSCSNSLGYSRLHDVHENNFIVTQRPWQRFQRHLGDCVNISLYCPLRWDLLADTGQWKR